MALYYGKHKVCPTLKGGTTPTGTIEINQNGNYDVTNYANANVLAYSIPREVDENGVYGATTATTYTLPSDIYSLADKALYYAFVGSSNLISMEFTHISDISGNSALCTAFGDCTSLKTLSFPALNSNSFGSYTNQFNNMLSGVTGCTVHFPSNLQSVIGSWSDVTSGFGGTNTTVLFDLPETT